ncbi:pectin lyase fold-containing protein [Neobacillus bataviensis LMG 21833]|uniref:Pectin lyase fold-containing protein n=1 Tax=Neobacillus bataviensis LMG 21833 TaxID=1117379 RepID=K6CYF9_9BACI|nr:right-handed parallel beta-helix repeat-containing protein [Neobacillus bataviensis]EKN65267.1 pectin lyase fold-containing protein [Neobacillus bataviensis LMG 21833]
MSARIIDVREYVGEANSIKDYSPIVHKIFQEIKGTKEDIILSFPKGIYHFYPDHAPKRAFHTSNTDTRRHPIKTVCFLIEEQENVTIEGNGSFFYFHGDVMGLGIFHSKNIRLQNFSWDYEVSTLSELVVEKTVGENGCYYAEYKLEEHVPYEISENQPYFYWLSERSPYSNDYYWKEEGAKNDMVIVGFDESTGVKRRYGVNEGPFAENRLKIEELERSHIRIHYNDSLPKAVVENRVFEFCKVIDRNTAGALIWESEKISLSNVTIHYLHGFGFLVQMSGDITFQSTEFIPNSDMGKHGSSFADSIHVSGAKGVITVDGCTFMHPHDDPINIHGTFTRIQKIIDEKTVEVIYAHPQQSGFPQYHIGDKVAFFNRATMDDEFEEEIEVTHVVHPGQDKNDLQTMQVTFNKELPFNSVQNEQGEFVYVMENVTYTPEVVIKNSRFAHVPTRGILCTTRRKVLIEGNHFQNMTMSTIFISNDSNDWYESGPVRDMTIRGNIFHVSPIEDWHDRKPAIYIHPIPLGEIPSTVPIHKNITVENNTFYMQHECVVSAENVENLTIRDNKIMKVNPYRKNDEVHDVLFEFDRCKNVLLEGNSYDGDFAACARITEMKDRDLKIKNEQTAVWSFETK